MTMEDRPPLTRTFDAWLESLDARHLADLRVPEVTRALRALSTDYVQRRHRVRGAALEGRGKRAAFALFYGPLHFLAVGHIVRALGAHQASITELLDLGCGTGAAGAAWAVALPRPPRLVGVDRHPWAVAEAAWTYRTFGLRHRATRGDVSRTPLPSDRATGTGILLAYTVNELADEERSSLLPRLVSATRAGAAVLIVEPIARTLTPWWPAWESALVTSGGRADQWRMSRPLPARLKLLDRAAGLNHREQTARSLWVPPS
jgi:hypothetical protein